MQQTTNYNLVKIELDDSPADITVLNQNWDKIDTEMKTLDGKTGGTVTGELTISGKVTANDGLDVAGGIVNGGEYKLKVDITKGQTPAEAKFATIGIYDESLKEGYRLGRVQYGIGTNNTASIAMYVNRPNDAESEDPSGILVQWLNGTTARISVTHHPDKASNDKSIATTNWVRSLTATTSEYGLVRLASESDILNETDETVMDVPLAYELNDFRRMNKAYALGDKVNCAFRFEFYLECTTAGTTSAETLDTRNVTHGQVISDGTCQWTVRAHVKSVNGNVPDANGNIEVPTTDTDTIKSTVLNIFFPVGSVYMSADTSFDPNTSWGGTWVKVENRFLLGSSESKAIGTTGGEETHTLTVDETPEHYHDRGDMNITGKTSRFHGCDWISSGWSGALYGTTESGRAYNEYSSTAPVVNLDASRAWLGTTNTIGGNQPHNNMPPYEVVNIWKRTA